MGAEPDPAPLWEGEQRRRSALSIVRSIMFFPLASSLIWQARKTPLYIGPTYILCISPPLLSLYICIFSFSLKIESAVSPYQNERFGVAL